MEPIEHLKQIEESVHEGEGTALVARWQSGQFLNTLKGREGRLPHGLTGKLVDALGVGKSEINARMKFATKYPSRDELTDAIGKFGSWFRIVREGLTDTPRPKAVDRQSKAARLVAAFGEIDPIELTPELLKQLKETIHRHEQSLATLASEEAA